MNTFYAGALIGLLLHLLAVETAKAQSRPDFGGRVNYQTIVLRSSPEAPLSQFFRSSAQLGIFWKWLPENRLSFRAEGNYSLKGYFLGPDNKVGYHYLGVAAIPEIAVSGPFSIGVGGFADFLILDPGDFPPSVKRNRLDAGPLLAGFLRYNRFEIQCRYQWGIVPFVSQADEPKLYFEAFSVGMSYYFRSTAFRTPSPD